MNTGSRAEARSGQWMLNVSGGIGVTVGVGEGIGVGDGVSVGMRVGIKDGVGVKVRTGVAGAQDDNDNPRKPIKMQMTNGK